MNRIEWMKAKGWVLWLLLNIEFNEPFKNSFSLDFQLALFLFSNCFNLLTQAFFFFFGSIYKLTVHLTSLCFSFQAFTLCLHTFIPICKKIPIFTKKSMYKFYDVHDMKLIPLLFSHVDYSQSKKKLKKCRKM